MWSEINNEYVKQLVLSNRNEYPYYLAQTVTSIESGSNYNSPTIKVYFSKEPITCNNAYSYTLPAKSICYSIVGGNGSRYSKDARTTITNISGRVNIAEYEFVYTNAEFTTYTIHPDITATNTVTQSHFQAGIALIIILLLATFTIRIFKG